MLFRVLDPAPARLRGHALDHLPAAVALLAGLLIGGLFAVLLWRLPALAAAPLYLLALAGAAVLARRGEPRLVPVAPARDEPAAEPQPRPEPPPEPLTGPAPEPLSEAPPENRIGPEPAPAPEPPPRPSLIPADWWVDIPAGAFLMGSPARERGRSDNEGPQHAVRVSAFRCLRYPVTAGLKRRLEGDPQAPLGQGDPPLAGVSWFDAVAFCNRLSVADGLRPAYRIDGEQVTWLRAADGYRLLTEAEWEYACRAGTQTRWSFGDDEARLGDYAWYTENSGYRVHPVGEKRPNRWGLHDMHGLVWEWCWDRYGAYQREDQADPIGPAVGVSRVVRGGSFYFPARLLRAALRLWVQPECRGVLLGFRCARAPAAGIDG